MDGLFNPISILWHIANAAILFVAVYFLLYKPVRKFMAAREAKVADTLEAADQKLAEARETAENGDQIISDAKARAKAILEEARSQAADQEKRLLENARVQAADIVKKARQEADGILKNAQQEMREQATELAIDVAQSILEREVNRADHEKVINDIIGKVD